MIIANDLSPPVRTKPAVIVYHRRFEPNQMVMHNHHRRLVIRTSGDELTCITTGSCYNPAVMCGHHHRFVLRPDGDEVMLILIFSPFSRDFSLPPELPFSILFHESPVLPLLSSMRPSLPLPSLLFLPPQLPSHAPLPSLSLSAPFPCRSVMAAAARDERTPTPGGRSGSSGMRRPCRELSSEEHRQRDLQWHRANRPP